MKYCEKCKRLHNDSEESCSHCNARLKQIEDNNTPVYLLTADGFEAERVKAALEDAAIPCGIVRKTPKYYPSNIVTGADNNLCNDVQVPYAAYQKAYDVCIGIGAIKVGEEELVNDGEHKEAPSPALDEEFEEMSPAKRTTVRVISAILFLLLVALTVFGTDFIMGLIKNLF